MPKIEILEGQGQEADRIAELKEKNDLMGSLEETLEETMRSLEDVLRDNALLCEVIGREVVHGDIGYRTVSLKKTQPLSLTSQQRKEVGEMMKRQEKLRTLMIDEYEEQLEALRKEIEALRRERDEAVGEVAHIERLRLQDNKAASAELQEAARSLMSLNSTHNEALAAWNMERENMLQSLYSASRRKSVDGLNSRGSPYGEECTRAHKISRTQNSPLSERMFDSDDRIAVAELQHQLDKAKGETNVQMQRVQDLNTASEEKWEQLAAQSASILTDSLLQKSTLLAKTAQVDKELGEHLWTVLVANRSMQDKCEELMKSNRRLEETCQLLRTSIAAETFSRSCADSIEILTPARRKEGSGHLEDGTDSGYRAITASPVPFHSGSFSFSTPRALQCELRSRRISGSAQCGTREMGSLADGSKETGMQCDDEESLPPLHALRMVARNVMKTSAEEGEAHEEEKNRQKTRIGILDDYVRFSFRFARKAHRKRRQVSVLKSWRIAIRRRIMLRTRARCVGYRLYAWRMTCLQRIFDDWFNLISGKMRHKRLLRRLECICCSKFRRGVIFRVLCHWQKLLETKHLALTKLRLRCFDTLIHHDAVTRLVRLKMLIFSKWALLLRARHPRQEDSDTVVEAALEMAKGLLADAEKKRRKEDAARRKSREDAVGFVIANAAAAAAAAATAAVAASVETEGDIPGGLFRDEPDGHCTRVSESFAAQLQAASPQIMRTAAVKQ